MTRPPSPAGEELHEKRRAAGIKLTVLARQLGREFDQAVEATGLSRAKFGVIAIVARFPGATQRTIAEYLEVTEVTAGRLIERLCADGYLERRDDPGDRRARRVYLTDRTGPVLYRIAAIAADHEAAVFAGLNEGDLAQLGALLDRISCNISTLRGDAAPAIDATAAAAAATGKRGAPKLQKVAGG